MSHEQIRAAAELIYWSRRPTPIETLAIMLQPFFDYALADQAAEIKRLRKRAWVAEAKISAAMSVVSVSINAAGDWGAAHNTWTPVIDALNAAPAPTGEGEQASGLTFARLREVNLARCNASFRPIEDWSPCDWMTAIAGEVGEAANLIKKLRRGREQVDVNDIGDELADAVTYLDLLATRLGLTLENHVVKKFNEVSKRVDSPLTLEAAPSQPAEPL